MDQVKVGNYISQKRKELGLTQKQLAELIEVTDKSISKWERGNGLPDVTRLKPLCDALKVSMNELVAGEDISESVLSQKTEENIMSLIKENEKQKTKSQMTYYVFGGILVVVALLLLGISIAGSSVQSVFFYIDVVAMLMVAVFIGIGVLLSKRETKADTCDVVGKMAISGSVFISLFELVMLLANMSDASTIGPTLSVVILTPLYGVAVYIVAAIVKTHIE